MTSEKRFTPDTEGAAHLVSSILRALVSADQDAGDADAMSEWMALIEAAARRAYFLLTGAQ